MPRALAIDRKNPHQVTPAHWTEVSRVTGYPEARTAGTEAMAAYKGAVLRSLEKRGWAWVEKEYDRLFRTKELTVHGNRRYGQLELVLDSLAPRHDFFFDANPDLNVLDGLRQAWSASGRSVFLSAVLGHLLNNTAHAWSTSCVAAGVRKRKANALLNEAREVLALPPSKTEASPAWHRFLCHSAMVDQSAPAEKAERYARAAAFDPDDAYLICARADQLLPGNHGSMKEIEAFARSAVRQSRRNFGRTHYSDVYTVVSIFDDIEKSNVSWPYLRSAYEDSLKHYPCQSNVNLYAFAAYKFRDRKTLHHIFTNHLALYISTWWSLEDEWFLEAFEMAKVRQRRAVQRHFPKQPPAQKSERITVLVQV